MEIQIVTFLGFVSVTVVFNTLIIFFAYKAFAGLTSKVTSTMSDVRANGETRQLIESLQVAAAQAAAATETTKATIAEFDPVLQRAQENYRRKLVEVDSKLEKAADEINTTARQVRDIVSKPAFSVATFAAGVAKVLQEPESEK
jgi:phosphoenolpyruvate carboxylase